MSKLSVDVDDVNRLLPNLISKLLTKIVNIDKRHDVDVRIKFKRWGDVLVWPWCENGKLHIRFTAQLLMISRPKMPNRKLRTLPILRNISVHKTIGIIITA
jgi:hypothetical protein